MGEINSTATADRDSAPKRKKLSTRVDLTPMVDLGFLLITFFIFTTSMSDPKEMKLILPSDKKPGKPMKTPESKTLNIILPGNNKIATYNGFDIKNTKLISGSDNSLRTIIIKKKKEIGDKFNDPDELIVLIKPTEEATYESIVNTLDEMTINEVKTYVFMEPSAEEINVATKDQ